MILRVTYPFYLVLTVFILFACKKSDSGSGPLPPSGPPSGPPVDSVPSITSISPLSGASSTLDTITGTGFTEKDSVFFNGRNAHIVSASPTQLVVKVPPQAGTGKVSITVSSKSATGPVFTFTGNTYLVSTFVGSGNPGNNNGTGSAASFDEPNSIAIDQNDNLYVVDFAYNIIRKITPAAKDKLLTFSNNNNLPIFKKNLCPSTTP